MLNKNFRSASKAAFIAILSVWMLFAFAAQPVIADDALSMYLENDSRGLKPNGKTDRHYTHGTKFVYLTQPDWDWLDDFADWNAALPDEQVDTVVGFFLGQNIYTPDEVGYPEHRKPRDRVFAGWLYTGMFAQRATDNLLEHIELNVGVIGPSSKAEQSQRCIHNIVNADKPKGWDEQIGDEPAVDFTWMRQQRLADGWLAPTQNTDVLAEYGFTAGSVHLQAQAGLTVRYGINLGNTFVPGRLDLPSGVSTFRKTTLKSGYLFARAAVRAVQYNRFLSGLSPEPVLGEFQIGGVYQCRKFEIGYSQTFFTREYKQQSANDSFGALTLSWQF